VLVLEVPTVMVTSVPPDAPPIAASSWAASQYQRLAVQLVHAEVALVSAAAEDAALPLAPLPRRTLVGPVDVHLGIEDVTPPCTQRTAQLLVPARADRSFFTLLCTDSFWQRAGGRTRCP